MAYPDYGTFPKYGGGGSFPESTPVSATTDTGYLAYSSEGRLFLPAATNYILNPSFTGDTNADGVANGWASYGESNGITTPSMQAGRTGGTAQRITVTSSGAAGVGGVYITTPVGSFAQNDYFTASFYINIQSVNGSINVAPLCYAKTVAEGYLTSYPAASFAATVGGWTRVSWTAQVTDATVNHLEFVLRVTGVGSDESVTFDIDDCMIEKSSVLTPYFDGSSSERGCSWSGTANASTSVRARTELTIPVTAGAYDQGMTIAGRMTPLFASTQMGASVGYGVGACLKNVADNASEFMWCNLAGSNSFRAYYPGSNNVGYATPFAVGDKLRAIQRHASGHLDFNVNGTTCTKGTVVVQPGGGTKLSIGWQVTSNSNWAYAYIGAFAICPARITDAETALLSTLLTTCNGAELYKWFYDRGYYGTLIIPFEGDSKAYIVGGGSTVRDNYTYTPYTATTDTGYEVYA